MSPASVRSGSVSLEVEQPLNQNEIIVRVIDPSAKSLEVSCTISRQIDAKGGKTLRLFTLTLTKYPKSRYTNTYVGIYRDEVDTPHGSTIVVEYSSPSEPKPLTATIKMIYH